jgi:hypothetical protein
MPLRHGEIEHLSGREIDVALDAIGDLANCGIDRSLRHHDVAGPFV